MANKEHLEILKKGVDAWNQWRDKNPEVRPDLGRAGLSGTDLRGINLSLANLKGAILQKTPLGGADLRSSNLTRAILRNADLTGGNLCGADLTEADLLGANCSGADLSGANLFGATLFGGNFDRAILIGADLRMAHLFMAFFTGANLSRADLKGTDLSLAHLGGADLSGSIMASTRLADVDLSNVKGLSTVEHSGPSTVGIDTIYRSKGKIPEVFLRGAGVPETFIIYVKSLVVNPIEYYSCFISYSSQDQEFAKKLHRDLQAEGVRCWFAPEDLKIGEETRPIIDEAIRIHDKLLIVLSENSVKSSWVKKEVETAFEKERSQNRIVLFPIRLDEAVMETKEAWAADIRRMRNIGDFREWKSHDGYKEALGRLLRDLKAEEKMPAGSRGRRGEEKWPG